MGDDCTLVCRCVGNRVGTVRQYGSPGADVAILSWARTNVQLESQSELQLQELETRGRTISDLMHELCDSRIYSAALGMPQRIAAISSPLPRNMQHRILPCWPIGTESELDVANHSAIYY